MQARGGRDAAKLMQAQKQAGGSWVLISLEWSTHDRETQLKESGASDRCFFCATGLDPATDPAAAGTGWVYLLHLDPLTPRRRKRGAAAQPHQVVHQTGYTADTSALLAATRNGGLNAGAALGLPEPPDGAWRLVRAQRGLPSQARLSERAAAGRCPSCHSDRSRAGAAALLAAIARGEVSVRRHPLHGTAARWHTRYGKKLTSAGAGGSQGRMVTAAVAALEAKGLVVLAEKGQGYGPGQPYMLTAQGLEALRALTYAAPPPRAGRADGLPANRDGSLSRSRTTEEEKLEAGVMTSVQQAMHTDLRRQDMPRRAERIRGPLPEDEWTGPALPGPQPPGDPSWPLPPGTGIAAGSRSRAGSQRRAATRRAGKTR